MFFSGPIPNPSLGAAVASAKIHLGPEHPILQQQLIERIRYTNDLAAQLGLPMIVYEETPIFFVAVSKPQVGYRVVQKMQDRGFFVNIASYPSVPLKNAGLRFTITNLHSFEDIQQMLLNLKKSLDEALDEERFSYEEIWHAFSKIAPPKKAAKAE